MPTRGAAGSATSHMTASRRSKLQTIQEREASKARRARLHTMLTQKLVQKYGSKRNPLSVLNAEITEEVRKFTIRASKLPSDEEFLELENAVRELRDSHVRLAKESNNQGTDRGDAEDSSVHCSKDSSKGDYLADERTDKNDCSTSTASNQSLTKSIARDWRTFDVAKQIEYETQQHQKAQQRQREKARFREELKRHRSHEAEKKAREDEEKRAYIEAQNKKLQEWKAEQETMKKRQADNHAEEKLIRQQQIDQKQKEREAERHARLESEKQDIERCLLELQQEADAAEKKRRMAKQRLADISVENAKLRELRAQKQRESDKKDMKLMEECRRKMDEDECRRAQDLKERMKHYEDIGNFWMERGAGKRAAKDEKHVEELTLIEARRLEEADIHREKMDKEKKRMGNMRMAQENRKVIEEKSLLLKQRHKEEMEYAQRFIEDSEAFKREQREKLVKKRQDMERYKQELQRQVDESKACRQQEDMSETEFKLNSDLAKRLEADHDLVAKVKQRLETTS